VSIPKDFMKVVKNTRWKEPMAEEIRALLKNNTWELTTFPTIKRVVGCEWVFFIKQKPNRSIDRYKASC